MTEEGDGMDRLEALAHEAGAGLLDPARPPDACAHVVAGRGRVALSGCLHHPDRVDCAWCSTDHLDGHADAACCLCGGDVGEVPVSIPWAAATVLSVDVGDTMLAVPASVDLHGRLCVACAADVT